LGKYKAKTLLILLLALGFSGIARGQELEKNEISQIHSSQV
jgi:hypothetical protein